ncbi:MAG TPA: hypothetical protein PKN33_10745 [Phycisphaerae bacterium]|nr:hypothetical protein [Phycisphaerae bacterium]
MGIRIQAYAIDVPRFDGFLEKSLFDLLHLYADKGVLTDSSENILRFTFYNANLERRHYCYIAAPDKGFIGPKDSGWVNTLESCPDLQQSARQFINTAPIYNFSWLLRAFSYCEGVEFIREITSCYRRWWVGSALNAGEQVLSAAEFDSIARLFKKVLRGWNCDARTPAENPGVSFAGFPVSPEDEPDLSPGRWTASETECALALIRRIRDSGIEFTDPSKRIRDDDDTDWNKWTCDMLDRFLAVNDLRLEECNVVTLIG